MTNDVLCLLVKKLSSVKSKRFYPPSSPQSARDLTSLLGTLWVAICGENKVRQSENGTGDGGPLSFSGPCSVDLW